MNEGRGPFPTSLTISIGLTVAVFLMIVRGGTGGIADTLGPLVFFSIVGCLAALLVVALTRPAVHDAVESALSRMPFVSPLRVLIALAALYFVLRHSGGLIISAGFGGWVVALLVCFVGPLVVCLIAPRWPIFVAVVTATCVEASLLFENAQRATQQENHTFWEDVFSEDLGVTILILTIAIGVSLTAAIPIHIGRSRSRRLEAADRSDPT